MLCLHWGSIPAACHDIFMHVAASTLNGFQVLCSMLLSRALATIVAFVVICFLCHA